MLTAISLFALAIWLYRALRKTLYKNASQVRSNYNNMQRRYDDLEHEDIAVEQGNLALAKNLNEMLALYDITKEICKSLELDGVFASFKEQITKYIEIRDCQFLKGNVDASSFNKHIVLPFKIDNVIIGYLVADIVKESDKDKFYILAHQLMLGIKRAVLYQKVQELSITDRLTHLFTRRYFSERFNEELERSKKIKCNFSFLMVDIDHFKECNDHYGHLVGDAVLREAAKTVKENIRQVDFAGRYGGEEFAVIFTETDKEQAKFAAERIRKAVEDKRIEVYDEELRITVSIGIATFPEDGQQVQILIDKADSALYQAKESGRNRVCIYGLTHSATSPDA